MHGAVDVARYQCQCPCLLMFVNGEFYINVFLANLDYIVLVYYLQLKVIVLKFNAHLCRF